MLFALVCSRLARATRGGGAPISALGGCRVVDGAGGATFDCPAQLGTYNYSCSLVEARTPQIHSANSMFIMDVS